MAVTEKLKLKVEKQKFSRFWLVTGSSALLVIAASAPPTQRQEPPPSKPREFFNMGTERLQERKFREAEAFLLSALAAQEEILQPPALYNLGHVRFGQGLEDLKKSPSSRQMRAAAKASSDTADEAIQEAEQAMAGEDIQRMVAAYLRGRGARKDLRQATKAVRQALDAYGDALMKWQRSSGDFKSASELQPGDADARQNADTVDRLIAKLVDSIRQMQQAAAALEDKKKNLGEKMKGLKGKIPEDQMPPGAAGDEEEEEDQPNGDKPPEKQSPGKQGDEQQMSLSPEQAAWLLEGYKLDSERRLPMGQQNTADPKARARKPW